ncbi:hypothetical protein RB195_014591 [Necator americanus]|uniref:Uncharacterized protein n=1 Tax=Necator americanus TaxID=51031 RepID=A0ABR1E3I8_NECAM
MAITTHCLGCSFDLNEISETIVLAVEQSPVARLLQSEEKPLGYGDIASNLKESPFARSEESDLPECHPVRAPNNLA